MRWRQNLFALFTAQAPHFLLFDRVKFLLPIWIPKELGPDQMAMSLISIHTLQILLEILCSKDMDHQCNVTRA